MLSFYEFGSSPNRGLIQLKLPLFATLVAISTASASFAQVKPTEVNELAVDEFGLERKTGRFSWRGVEVVAIGDGEARVNLVASDIRQPAWAATIWPEPGFRLNLNEPQLISFQMPDYLSTVPGALKENAFERTVNFEGESETFRCFGLICQSEYFLGTRLEPTGGGYLYTNRQGVTVLFTQNESRVNYPDGREFIRAPGKYWKNNYGFALKFSPEGIQAVNRAISACPIDDRVKCSSLSVERAGNIATQEVGVEKIVDAGGGITKLRWGFKTAKRSRPPLGSQPQNNIPSITIAYPLGITYPGSAAEDITIQYKAIDPNFATHDDVWVSSITKAGVTASYAYDRVFPYGVDETAPSIPRGSTADGLLESMSLGYASDLNVDCYAGSDFACNAYEQLLLQIEFIQTTAQLDSEIADMPAELRELEELGSRRSEVYEFKIFTAVQGEPAGESFTLKPAGVFGSSRRRLLYNIDALGRKTEFYYNPAEEVSAAFSPEGGGVFTTYDGRRNVIGITTVPKEGSGSTIQVQSYTYPPECNPATQAFCNLPVSMTDPRGGVTEFTYNDRGQLLTETKSAPVAGAPRPKVVNTYSLRTAYVRDGSGSIVAAGPPISLLTRSMTCISSADCSDASPSTEKIVTDYDYGPVSGVNNLLLRGVTVTAANAQGQVETLRTCYGYNYFGERISETQPAANLGVCP